MSKSAAVASGDSGAVTGDVDHSPHKVGFWALTLGCIGVVYGDIGTSPLYAFREAVLAAAGSGQVANEPVVLGILSLIIWALFLVVTAKYVMILLRADNNGEGGTLALMALASRAVGRRAAAPASLSCSASSAPRCSTATPSSRRRCRCSRRLKVRKS